MDERLKPYLDAGYTIHSQGAAGVVLVAPRIVPRRLIALLVITPLVVGVFLLFLTLTAAALLCAFVALIGGLIALGVYLLRPRRQVVLPPV